MEKTSATLHNELEKFRVAKNIILKDFLKQTKIAQGSYYALKNDPFDKETRIQKVVEKVTSAFPDFSFSANYKERKNNEALEKEVDRIIEKWEYYMEHSKKFKGFVEGKIDRGLIIELRKELEKRQ